MELQRSNQPELFYIYSIYTMFALSASSCQTQTGPLWTAVARDRGRLFHFFRNLISNRVALQANVGLYRLPTWKTFVP